MFLLYNNPILNNLLPLRHLPQLLITTQEARLKILSRHEKIITELCGELLRFWKCLRKSRLYHQCWEKLKSGNTSNITSVKPPFADIRNNITANEIHADLITYN